MSLFLYIIFCILSLNISAEVHLKEKMDFKRILCHSTPGGMDSTLPRVQGIILKCLDILPQ